MIKERAQKERIIERAHRKKQLDGSAQEDLVVASAVITFLKCAPPPCPTPGLFLFVLVRVSAFPRRLEELRLSGNRISEVRAGGGAYSRTCMFCYRDVRERPGDEGDTL